jgi:anti-sigma regulatory factor (Ser/Thr protein kinase)
VPAPEPVRLTVPAESRYVRLVRLAAAGVATEAGFDVDDVEDLRVAVNELFALMVDDSEDPQGTVDVTYTAADGTVSVQGTRKVDASAPDPGGPEDLALEILRVVVDEHDFSVADGLRTFSLVKRVPVAPA